ncbi:penicillin-binding protein 1A [Colwellia psychrerythraea]|uniref:Penicillin-binding protein 1A n=1 Tax=Colwellia psychrerythraea (strain 34H / ATCC BAA-681) TaxID=167879 RepID=Q489P0_COLP3|nr:penicillin-binding protein 1A [Colwellia psychrerythraea]AAZ27165.1 penicillin-binding protein [Colwellia psychrerythraea 34H]
MLSIKNLLKVSLILLILVSIAVYSLYLSMRSDLPSVELLKDLHWQTPLQVYSQDGLLISQFGEKKRTPLTLEEVPQQLIDALLATEDDRFYLHFGVDPIGMGRAVLGKLMGQDKGGASTITMQVARNFFLTREVTYTRKIREIFLSFHIENLLSKDEILMLYINKIELGHRAFGFGAAAQVYYGKEIHELNLAQIAVLAGLPKAPSTLNPIRSPKRAQARRSVVLQRMLVSGYISDLQYQTAKNAPITGKRHGAEIELNAPYIAEMAHNEVLKRYGKDKAYTEGYKVFTTVTAKLQTAAEQALVNNLLNYDQRHGYRGPLSSLRPQVRSTDDTSEIQIVPLLQKELSKALSDATYYQMLEPAIVLAVEEKSVSIQLRNKVTATIKWQGLAWARPYINDQKQGRPPKTAKDILTYGDVILVSKMTDNNYRLGQLPTASAAIVSLSPNDGAIKAAVGGFSFKQSQFNRVTQAKRQVGSNIKPFIYSAALEHGFTLASLVNDAPINQWDKSSGVVWRPRNSPEKYVGLLRVRLALAQSKNVIAVRLLKSIGVTNTIKHLTTFGFNANDLPRNETLALGSASLTPLEVATGFAAFANGGFLVEPYLIQRIENSDGEIIYQADPAIACDPCIQTDLSDDTDQELDVLSNNIPDHNITIEDEQLSKQSEDDQTVEIKQASRIISPQNAFLITQALNSAIWGADWNTKHVWQGTGFRARTLKRRDIAGKTGTTNEAKDAWFSGFSRNIVTTSWIGFDDPRHILGQSVYNNNLGKNQTTGKEFGAKSAQPAWIDFMRIALADAEPEAFQPPVDIVSVRIDKTTGKLTTKTDKTSQFEYFRLGKVPTEYVTEDSSSEILSGGQQKEEEEELF